MNQLIKVLTDGVLKQCKSRHCNIVRIENFDHPLVYRGLCESIKASGKFDMVSPKLTEEKYQEFVAAGCDGWKEILEYFHQGDNLELQTELDEDYIEKSFVDFGNAMTKWRNKSAEYTSSGMSLILLLGTETATDTGGLADTSYVISPKELISDLSRKYSKWFQEVLSTKGLESKECAKSVHNIYSCLFSKINVDLFQLSQFIDDLHPLDFSTEQDFINHICETLHIYWNVPSIKNLSSTPRISALSKGKKGGKIIEEACKFIQESGKPLTASKTKQLEKQCTIYASEHDIDLLAPFPSETNSFPNFEAFQTCLVDFLNGKNKEENRNALLFLDYAIISQIYAQKLPNEKVSKDKVTALKGEPMEVYSNMFLSMINLFQKDTQSYPTHIVVKITHVSLADCDDSTKEASFGKLCQYLGGILDFFKHSSLAFEGEPVIFSYEGEMDPFAFCNFDAISSVVKSSGKWGEPSKIDFTVKVSGGTTTLKGDFRWSFSPYSDWLNAFYYLASLYQEVGENFEATLDLLPSMVTCQRMHEYRGCEASEDFYSRLLHLDSKNLFPEHKEEVTKHFSGTPLYQTLMILNMKFFDFWQEISQTGLFTTINMGLITQLTLSYSQLMESIKNHYNSLSQIQKEKLPLLINCYMITSNTKVLENGQMDMVLLPSYHPSMLEKIEAKLNFIRTGFLEMCCGFSSTSSTQSLTQSLAELIQISSITQGVDLILDLHGKLIPCQEVWGYFCVYYHNTTIHDVLSASSVATAIVVDEETSETLLTSTPISTIVLRNILDYVKTFPSRMDGLSVSFLAPLDMQHIVAAIHSISKMWNDQGIVATIHLKIITLNSQKNSASYLRRWLDSYFSEEQHVRVNTSLRNLTGSDREGLDCQSLESMVEGDDLCFIYQVLEPAQTHFFPVSEDSFDPNLGKFPMVFLPEAISSSHGKERKYCISQPQFPTTSAHTQANAIHNNPYNQEGEYQTFQTLSLDDEKIKLLESVHKQCKWVVCLDKSIDRAMLEKHLTKDGNKIVGFSTGEGTLGELNVTVSAKKVILDEIKIMLQKRIREKFTHWEPARLEEASKYCVEELTPFMDGSRILKALNPYDYEVHSYLAYTLMIQKLDMTQRDDGYFLRRLVSLDSYLHWFDSKAAWSEEKKRPDFMLLEIPKTEKNLDPNAPLELRIQVIECKMGFISDAHVDKAKIQLEQGLNTLIHHWSGNKQSVKLRYWLNQLYRVLIFSPLQVEDSSPEFLLMRNKIHGVLHGNYEIDWSGALYAFWLNSDVEGFESTQLSLSEPISVPSNGEVISELGYHYCGQLEIQRLLLPPNSRSTDFDYVHLSEESLEEILEELEKVEELEELEELQANTPEKVVAQEVPEPSLPQEEAITISAESNTDQTTITPSNSTPENAPPSLAVPETNIVSEKKEAEGSNTVEEEVTQEQSGLEDVRFLIGEDSKTKQKCYWEFGHKGLPNRHLLINGNSGCGKTYCIQTLLMESALQGISSVVFDYTGGFENEQLQDTFKEKLQGKITQRYVITEKIPINPFKAGTIMVNHQLIPDSPVNIATRISETFAGVYKFGDQQKSAIYSAVRNGVKSNGNAMNISVLEELLEEMDSSYSRTVLSKIQAFIDIDVFAKGETFDWSELRDSGGTVYVIQLQGYSRDVQMMLTELMLWDIWNFSVSQGKEEQPFILVMDEAQNLNHGENSPSGKFLTEGRKFGISAWYATQFMKPQLSDDEIQRLQQASQKLYFCPPDDGVLTIAKSIDINATNAKEWAERLKKLKKGECVVCGYRQDNNKLTKDNPRIVSVESLENRL